jgi:photosystem II stability/assembly factor-like uncharacterized protein
MFVKTAFLILTLLSPLHATDLDWRNIGPGGGSDLHFLAIHPENADIMYVSGDIEGAFKSTDGGNTWRNINGNLAHGRYGGDAYFTNDIVIDPTNHDRVYLPTSTGLFVSETGADTWTLLYPDTIATEDDAVSVATVAVDPTDANRLFAGLGNGADGSEADFAPFAAYDGPTGLLISTDKGSTWQTADVGMPAGNVIHSVVINPTDTQQIFLSTTSGIYQSSDGGTVWQSVNTGLPHTNCHRLVGRDFDGTFFLVLTVKVLGTAGDASSHSGGIYRSSDAGATWTNITGNLPTYDVDAELFYDFWQFDVNPTDADNIYAATVRGSGFEVPGIYATWDGGVSWDHLYTPAEGGWMDPAFFGDPYAFALKIAPSNPSRVVITGDRVDLTDDGGDTWIQKYTDAVGNAWKGRGIELMNTDGIAFDPQNAQSYYIGYDDMGLFRTDDGGESYTRLDPKQDPEIGAVTAADGVKDIVVDPESGELYITRWQGSQGGLNDNYARGGMVYSSDRGQSVTDRSAGLPQGRGDLIMLPGVGSAGQRTLINAVFHHGIYRSSDSGLTWMASDDGLGTDADKGWELAVDPTDPARIYLGLNHRGAARSGLYRSTDSGLSWSVLSNFPEGDVQCVYVDAASTVYASITDNFDWSTEGGLYRSMDGGNSWTMINDHPRVVDLDIDPNDANRLLATGQAWYRPSSRDGELLLSEDGGTTWEIISTGVAHTFFNFGRFDTRRGQTELLAGTAGGGLWSARLQTETSATPLTGDFDGSGIVDFPDFLLFAAAFGTASSTHDLDGSGTVDFPDFLIFVANFGNQAS